jgi:subtilisin family serine protease
MNSRLPLWVVFLSLIVIPVSGFNLPDTINESYKEGEVVIKFSRTCTPEEAADIAAALGATVKYRFRISEAEHWRISLRSVAEAIQLFGSDPRVEYILPNYRIYLDSTYPNDPRFNQLWGMYNRGEVRGQADADIDATDAWDIETGGDIIVGVCDSGVDYTHEDIAANIFINPNEIPDNGIDDDNNGFIDDVRGWDFGDEDNDPMDPHGHGTHVSGTIAAVGNNGIGVTGVNWNAKILPLKIVDSQGDGFTAPAAKAIEYAILMGARVTNHSWGGGNPFQPLKDAIIAAEEAGVLTVASAGNAGRRLDSRYQHFPAGLPYDGIVSVANTTRDDRLAGSSNWSPVTVDLGAPGSGVVSTTPNNNYESFSGTSMSAPHVTGAIALIWSHAPHLTLMEMKNLLITTVDSLPDLIGTTVSGGRLNLHRALATLDTESPQGVENLAASLAGPTAVALTWTASGDDGVAGTAKRYDIRYSDQPIDPSNFNDATPILDPPSPQPSGVTETHVVSGLNYGTDYYFALRVFDSHNNSSPLSNSAMMTTLTADPPPQAGVSPPALVKTLMTGTQATKEFSITNTGTGNLEWMIQVLDGGFIPGAVALDGEMPVLINGQGAEAAYTGPPIGVGEGFLHDVRIVFDISRGQAQDRWDDIITDLQNRGAVVTWSSVLFAPSSLDSVDVLWITDVPPPASISHSEIMVIAQWVRSGGGLLLEGDDDITCELYNRILSGLSAGIEYSPEDGAPGVSDAINLHPTTDGVSTLLFDQNGSHLSRVTEPAQLLIADPAGNASSAFVEMGSGRILAMSDELLDDFRSGAGDHRHFANRVFAWLAGGFWVAARPSAGIVSPGQSTVVEATFDARGLAGGIYQGELLVVSNDPVSPSMALPVTLGVTAAPDIAMSHASVDFGIVFTAISYAESLAVHNSGKETLIVSDVNITGGDYTVDTSEFTLAPGEGLQIAVTVSPTSSGILDGSLSITSNDPDNSLIVIPLTAESHFPPIISAVPDSLHEARYGDEVVQRTLTLSNDGEYDLEFFIVVEDEGTGISSAPGSQQQSPQETFRVPSGEMLTDDTKLDVSSGLLLPDAAGGTKTNGVIIFSDDFEDGDFDGWEDRGFGSKEATDETAAGGTIYSYHEFNSQAGHFNGVLKQLDPIQPAYVSFYIRSGANDEADGYFVLTTSENRYLTYVYFSSSGHMCINAGNPGQDCSIVYDVGRWYFVELKNIDFESQTLDYYVDRILIKEDVPFMAPTDDIAGILLYNYTGGSQGWWDEVVVASANVVTWLTTDPSYGVVTPYTSGDIQITLDATQMYTGQYQHSIVISSNDPITPEVRIPAIIDITAVPNIAFSRTLLDFAKVIVGASATVPFKIINRSLQETLVVSSIVSDNPSFTPDSTTTVVPPGGRNVINVTFSPGGHGISSGVLTVTSNDRDQPVLPISLTGKGVDAPILSVQPDSIYMELMAGEAAIESIFVSNIVPNPDAADLEFSFWADDHGPLDWLALSPKLGIVPPGSTAVLIASIHTYRLIEGEYPGHIMGFVNIPNTGLQTLVSLMLHINGLPSMVLADSLDFGTTHLGYPVALTMPVRNAGTATLTVDNISIDSPEFTALPASFTVPPDDTTDVEVTFVPESIGPVTATLTVSSNDTSAVRTDIILSASVVNSPAAWISADSIWTSVKQTKSRVETITLGNNGNANLEWKADLSFERDVSGSSQTANAPAESLSVAAPDTSLMDVLWYGSHGPLGSAFWSVAISDIVASGGTVNENSSPVDESLLEPYDILWLGDTDTAFSEEEINTVAAWVESGGSLLIEADNATAITSYQQLLNAMGSFIQLYSNEQTGGYTDKIWEHEATLNVATLFFPKPSAIIVSTAPPAGILATNQTRAAIVAAHVTIGKGRVVVITDWLFSDFAINSADNRRFMRQLFGWLSGAGWLSIMPLDGILPVGQQVDISLTFEPGDIPPDAYLVQLDISTNDPSQLLIEIPLVMQVDPLISHQVDLLMSEGLNLRSWNVELEAESTSSILAPIMYAVESVQGFDGGGLTFDPSIPPQFNTLQIMDHYHGYWFRLNEPVTLSLDGTVFDHLTPLPLQSGYNLIGYFPDAPDSTAHAIQSVIDRTEVVLGYDEEGLTFDPSIPPHFNTLQLMKPGFGYWIKLNESDTLYYPELPAALVQTAASATNQSLQGGKLPGGTVSSDQRDVQVVPAHEWIGVWGDEVRVEGDPIDTGTIIIALDEGGTVCGRCIAHNPGQFGLMAVYRDDPVTERDEGAARNEAITVVVGQHAFEGLTWTEMGAVINFNDVARMVSATDNLPQRTVLHHNYPNPFNPITTISYDLAASEVVTLAIFDVRGRRVLTLVSGRQPAGRYQVEWDGRDSNGHGVASGVYFYRFVAGSYTLTRKLVLLK